MPFVLKVVGIVAFIVGAYMFKGLEPRDALGAWPKILMVGGVAVAFCGFALSRLNRTFKVRLIP